MSCLMMLIVLTIAAAAPSSATAAEAALTWSWAYSGPGISAAGNLTTSDKPDADGFYRILGISGSDNGVMITALQPTGTAIPGNEPYAVDNLLSAAIPQLTVHGFGFALANGNYANPFHGGSGYFEYLSSPPYTKGTGIERPVSFAARIVPEPSSVSIMLAALAGLLGCGRRIR